MCLLSTCVCGMKLSFPFKSNTNQSGIMSALAVQQSGKPGLDCYLHTGAHPQLQIHGSFDIFPFAGGWMSLTPLCLTLFPTPEQEQHIPHWINISWKSFRWLNVKRETTSEVRLCTDQAHVESFVLPSR